ncbi:DNA-binding MarR family transcriptional regulator [Hydrogenispora ethanolica]|uniref:DNA-binding MarR family transcriptional regulator n=1 Tax=Hydrogenispora ethanolica TaxID=1082276 RepID=A0A4R1RK79_HYDET|nr:MarR family transcriptional regulator [Hydrogenispora ethanolica]TCL66588.1 DNA-binding MarR family transcriptional regulator [Hydrogenispora ethanolica]
MDNQTDAKIFRELVRRLERKLGLLDELEASCCGISFAQCHAMVEIGRAGSISLNDLADILTLDKSTMSRTINNLVANDLVSREIDPGDRRYVAIQLTESGQKAFQTIERGMAEFFANVYQSIPESKREQVLDSLEILLAALAENDCCKNLG